MIVELERFITVVEEGSFTKAAQKLFLTQPALSQSIARLEKEIGVLLLKHTGKHIVLTKDGEAVHTVAQQIQKLWEKIKDPESRNLRDATAYSIGLFDNAALKLSSYFKKKLSQKDILFEIMIDRSEYLLRGMQQGLFDLAICVIPQEKNWGDEIILTKTFLEKLYPVSGKRWNKKVPEIPFILYNKNSSTRQYVDGVFLEHGIKPTVIVESTDPNFMKELAIAGSGIALLPKNIIERELEQKKLFIQKFPFSFQREIGFFLSKESSIKISDKVVREIISNL